MCKRWSVALATLCFISAIGVVPHAGGSARPQPSPKEKAPRLDHLGDPLPEHALLRIGSNRLRPGVPTSMAFSTDGKRLVTINSDTAGHVWDSTTGKMLLSFGRPLRREGTADLPVGDISTDGSLAALLDNDGMLRVYDTATGKPSYELKLPEVQLAQITISADNKLLAYGDVTRMLFVWDLTNSKEPLWSSDVARSQVVMPRLAFGPDGKSLAMLNNNSHVEFLEARTGKPLRTLDIKTVSDSQWLYFAPDGKTFLTRTGYNTGTLIVRDAATGEPLKSLYHEPAVSLCDLATATYSPDSKSIVVANASVSYVQVFLWDVATGKQRRVLPCPFKKPKCLAMSPDGTLLAGGDREGFISLWETNSGKAVVEFEGHRVPGIEVRFATDGKRLISMSKALDPRWGDENTGPRFWDASTGKVLPKAASVIPDLGWVSGNGQSYVFSGTDANVWLYDLVAEKYGLAIGPSSASNPIISCRLCDEGRILVTGGGRSFDDIRIKLQGLEVPYNFVGVEVWDTATGRSILTAKTDRLFCHADERNVYLQVSPIGEFVYWDYRIGQKTTRHLQKWNMSELNDQSIAVAPNSRFIAPSFKARTVVPGSVILGNPPEPKPAGDLTTVRVWDINTGQQIAALRSDNERLKCMAISPDSSIVAAGSVTGNIYLWSLGSDKPIAKLTGHRNSIFSLDFSSDGRRLVSGSDDTTILVWDVARWTDHAKKPHVPLGNDAIQLWKALAETASPYPAIERFLQAPKETVEFLRGKLSPPVMDDIRKKIAALDNSKFTEREQAMAALRKLGMEAKPALLAVLKGNPTLEVRRRVQMLLTKLENEPLPAESLQTLRGLDILEMLATPAAIELLDTLSKGDPDTWLTQEAAWALKRARKRVG